MISFPKNLLSFEADAVIGKENNIVTRWLLWDQM